MGCVRPLEPSDREAALALWQARFSDSDAFCAWYFSERFTPSLSAGVFEGDLLLSMALGRPITLRAAGGDLPAVLVAGVSTRCGYERRGHMRAAMERTEALARAAGAAIAVLRPVDSAIYLPLGYVPYSAACLAFGTGKELLPLCRPTLLDPAQLADCYAEAVRDLSVRLYRDDGAMAARLAEVECDGGMAVALTDGTRVRAYALLETPNGDAVEAAARTEADLVDLLDALASGCMALLPPQLSGSRQAPGARIPHLMAKPLLAGVDADAADATLRFLPEEY